MIETVGDLKELLNQYPDKFPVYIKVSGHARIGDLHELQIDCYELAGPNNGVNDVILIVE